MSFEYLKLEKSAYVDFIELGLYLSLFQSNNSFPKEVEYF